MMVDAIPPVIDVEHLSKSFGAVTALRDVSLHLNRGEVLGLVGDNGAGKSTLIKILCGFHKPDSGTYRFDGQPVQLNSPIEARALGIQTVYQDLALVNDLSVYHNMFLGRERKKRILGIPLLDSDTSKVHFTSKASGRTTQSLIVHQAHITPTDLVECLQRQTGTEDGRCVDVVTAGVCHSREA